MSLEILIRDARVGDLDAIVDFNLRLASETEHHVLDRAVLDRGVRAALSNPDRLRYWVAEATGSGEILAQAAVTREWSDWRDGWLWWLQSVYVRPDTRRLGAFRSLYVHIRSTALRADQVVGLRLYVEHANTIAQATYRALGMSAGGYEVYEEIWPRRSDSAIDD